MNDVGFTSLFQI